MNTTLTIAQEAYSLLQTVPAEDFLTERFTDRASKCCSIGHYQRLKSSRPSDFGLFNCADQPGGSLLRDQSKDFIGHKVRSSGIESIWLRNGIYDISDVNNGPTEIYPQEDPKSRVLAFLVDMIEAGY